MANRRKMPDETIHFLDRATNKVVFALRVHVKLIDNLKLASLPDCAECGGSGVITGSLKDKNGRIRMKCTEFACRCVQFDVDTKGLTIYHNDNDNPNQDIFDHWSRASGSFESGKRR